MTEAEDRKERDRERDWQWDGPLCQLWKESFDYNCSKQKAKC